MNDGVTLSYSFRSGRSIQDGLESVVDSVTIMALPEDMRESTQQATRDVDKLTTAWKNARNELEADLGSESLKEAF